MSTQDDKKLANKMDDEHFQSLYESALLDEDFQQQRISDLQQLPAERQHLLNAKEHAFIHDEHPSTALMQQLTHAIKHHQSTISETKKSSFWQRLLSRGEHGFSFLSPVVTVPSALVFGMFFGLLFAPLFTTPTSYTDDQFRGTNNTNSTHNTSTQHTMETMEENPQYWLEYIANLLEKGKLTLATEELDRFKQHYPHFEQHE